MNSTIKVSAYGVVFTGIMFFLGGILGALLWNFLDVSTGLSFSGYLFAWTVLSIFIFAVCLAFTEGATEEMERREANLKN